MKIRVLKSAVIVWPLALVALVCSLAVRQHGPTATADPAGRPDRLERHRAESPNDHSTRAFSTAPASNRKPADESAEDIAANPGSWALELRELRELAAQDFAAALVRISQMPIAEEREAALKDACLHIATTDPALAMNAAWELELGRLGGLPENATLEDLARRWAVADLSAALAWVARQAPDESGRRDCVVKGIALAWSEQSPADAARFVAEQMSPDYAQSDAAIRLAGRWAATDFFAAAAWVDLFPEGSIRDHAREEMFRSVPTQQ